MGESLCWGWGQALGLEQAAFAHVAQAEIDPHACATLRENRPELTILEKDIRAIKGKDSPAAAG